MTSPVRDRHLPDANDARPGGLAGTSCARGPVVPVSHHAGSW